MDSSEQAYSVAEFCSAFKISRALYYLLLRDGRAPVGMKIGRRRIISAEAAAAWRKRMESETLKAAA